VDLTRRQLLTGVLASGALAACSGSSGAAAASPDAAPTAAGATPSASAAVTTSSAAAAASPSATATATLATSGLPSLHPWTPQLGEVHPAVKAQATRLIEAVGTWSRGDGDLASARARASAAGFAPTLADALAPLLGTAHAAVVRVRDAQYGGILTSSSSVLVVVDQWRAHSDGTVTPGGTTVDVRLVAASPRWRVVDAFPAKPGAARTRLSATARAALASSRVRLPYAARADVTAGTIHDSVLALVTSLSLHHVVDVSVLRSGHPLHVFGTSRTSDHPRGRAVDVWALDGRPLVLPANHGLAASAMRYAVGQGAYNVGGPVLLSGPQYFSDRTHQDHIHLGLSH
jgi:hypothetical protein